jgi:hypothetical protein
MDLCALKEVNMLQYPVAKLLGLTYCGFQEVKKGEIPASASAALRHLAGFSAATAREASAARTRSDRPRGQKDSQEYGETLKLAGVVQALILLEVEYVAFRLARELLVFNDHP